MPKVHETFAVTEWTPREAADHIRESWQNAVESIIETGRRLIEAKAKVPHGQWLDTIALLPFSESTAKYLTQIAKHPDLSNRQHAGDLPASWYTLAVLAQLPPGEIPKLIEQHQITPELERSQAQEWVNLYRASQQESLNAWSQFCDHYRAMESYISSMTPPESTPDNYPSVEQIAEGIQHMATIAKTWRS